MGACESLFSKEKNNKTQKIMNKIENLEINKPVQINKKDEKSEDTMEYLKISVNRSYDSNAYNAYKKKLEEKSIEEKEKSTNDTNQQQIKQDFANLLDSNKLNINEKNVPKNNNEEFLPNGSATLNNLINQNNGNNMNILNTGSQRMNASLGMSNNYNNIGYNNMNGSNSLYSGNYGDKINVSLHESRFSNSVFLNIPKQDQCPISNINSLSVSMFQSK